MKGASVLGLIHLTSAYILEPGDSDEHLEEFIAHQLHIAVELIVHFLEISCNEKAIKNALSRILVFDIGYLYQIGESPSIHLRRFFTLSDRANPDFFENCEVLLEECFDLV